jgi:putative membrane protein
VGLGALIGLFAFIKFKQVQRQIDQDAYQSSSNLDIVLTLSVVLIGTLLIIYLIHTTRF